MMIIGHTESDPDPEVCPNHQNEAPGTRENEAGHQTNDLAGHEVGIDIVALEVVTEIDHAEQTLVGGIMIAEDHGAETGIEGRGPEIESKEENEHYFQEILAIHVPGKYVFTQSVIRISFKYLLTYC